MKDERGYTIARIDEITGVQGYIVGHFMAEKGFLSLQSGEVECALMELPVVDPSKPHFHRLMTEITVVLSGRLTLIFDKKDQVEVGEREFFVVRPGTVLQNPENEADTKIIVIKYPSIPGDKYYVEE